MEVGIRCVFNDSIRRLGESSVSEIVKCSKTLRRNVGVTIRECVGICGWSDVWASNDLTLLRFETDVVWVTGSQICGKITLGSRFLGFRDLRVEMDGWHDEIDMLSGSLGNAVFVAAKMSLTCFVAVELILCPQQSFYLSDGSVKIQPISPQRQSNPRGFDPRGSEPVADGINRLLLGRKEVGNLFSLVSTHW